MLDGGGTRSRGGPVSTGFAALLVDTLRLKSLFLPLSDRPRRVLLLRKGCSGTKLMLWPAPFATLFLALLFVLRLLRLLLTLLLVLLRRCSTLEETLPSLEVRGPFFRRGGRIGVFVLVVASESEKRLVVLIDPRSSLSCSFSFISVLRSESVFCFCFCFFIVSRSAW